MKLRERQYIFNKKLNKKLKREIAKWTKIMADNPEKYKNKSNG